MEGAWEVSYFHPSEDPELRSFSGLIVTQTYIQITYFDRLRELSRGILMCITNNPIKCKPTFHQMLYLYELQAKTGQDIRKYYSHLLNI